MPEHKHQQHHHPSNNNNSNSNVHHNKKDWRQLQQLVETFYHRDDAHPFREPLDWEAHGLTDYPLLIQRPMDLGTIRQRLLEQLAAVVVGSSDDNDCNSNSFYSSFAHVHQDVRLVFNNCMYYHPENTYYYNVAETLRTHWDAGYQNFLNNLKSKETTSIVTEQEVTSTKTTPARQQRHHRRIQNFARALHRISAIDVGDILFEVETKCPGALQRTMQQEQQQDMVLSDSSSPATIQQHDSSTSDINSKCNSNASNTTQQQQQQQMMIQLDVDYLTEAFLDEIEPVVEAALEGRNASSLQQRHNLEEETTVQKQDYVDDNTNDTDDDDDDDDDDDFIEPSVPTPPPSQVDPQQETALRREYSASTEQLPASEEKRNLCWKKAEFEIPHQHMDPNRYNTTMPALHFRTSTTSQNLPRQAAALPTVAVDTPAARPWYPLAPPPPPYHHHHHQQQQPLAAGQIESKYSTARVRQRTASDGTVAPVSTPKKTKDGLYQRPAGRTRKEMEWDAVRGVWVPSRAHG